MLKSEIISIVIAPTPLIKAENAIEIDNSNLTRDEQFEMVLALVNEAVKKA
jgi:cytidylate kinase